MVVKKLPCAFLYSSSFLLNIKKFLWKLTLILNNCFNLILQCCSQRLLRKLKRIKMLKLRFRMLYRIIECCLNKMIFLLCLHKSRFTYTSVWRNLILLQSLYFLKKLVVERNQVQKIYTRKQHDKKENACVNRPILYIQKEDLYLLRNL